MAPAEGSVVRIEVLYCPRPGVIDSTFLAHVEPGTVAAALQASGVLHRHGLDAGQARVGVWNHACEPNRLLRDDDRVEVYRLLTVDPKEARRLRYKRHLDADKSAPPRKV